MKALINVLLLALLLCVALAPKTYLWATTQGEAAQRSFVGEVVRTDSSGKTLTVKTDFGEVEIIATDASALMRIPPGETSTAKASKISFSDIVVGDRLFARVNDPEAGKPLRATQIVVSAKSASGARDRIQEFRARGVAGRVTEINPQTKQIGVLARVRDGIGTVNIDASGKVRFFHYAADSVSVADARASSLSELRVGDQLRALGNKSDDGMHLTAEEIIFGSFKRTGGVITQVDASRNQMKVRHPQTGETTTIALGQRSSMRRITPEIIAAYEEARRRVTSVPASAQTSDRRAPSRGRSFQEMIESLPVVSLGDLKKGDTVFVVGTHEQDQSRLTAITLLTGNAEFLTRLLQTETGRGPQNPGLPGDILGGGVGNRDDPTSP